MPLSEDAHVVKTATELLESFREVFGKHAGYRPAHAKGIMATGTFLPTPQAGLLTRAPHFNQFSTKVQIRYSDSTGIPRISDKDPNSFPRGMAIRFNLGPHHHTDLVAHSVPLFPVRTGEEFLAFLAAIIHDSQSSKSQGQEQSALDSFLSTHPAAKQFVEIEKAFPTSLARESYYCVSAFKAINTNGVGRFVRFAIKPALVTELMTAEALEDAHPDFLHQELTNRLSSGGGSFEYKLMATLAQDGDEVDDSTVQWPSDRETVHLGTIRVEDLSKDSIAEQKQIIFDPIPRVDGIEASNDPLFEVRAALYLLGGRERRAA